MYDTSTSTISNVNITQTNVRPGTYTFLANFPSVYRGGQHTANVALGDETWWINTTGILANGGSYSAAAIGTGNCISMTGGVCTTANTANSRTNVTITSIAASPVPTLSEWAMILFGVLLAGGAALFVQQRQRAV
ncbi:MULTISPECIES: IPTL-CTERM sorting domain-containing protein [unclassified Brevundimonas]|uniref:IPTL-CTERM sorting domain-containing protein n=1 Tax=unclassified Brevundimonas TaxID=2622653 RepID=UPI003F9081FD